MHSEISSKATSASLTETVKYTSRESTAALSLSEVISALSLALDLTEGAVQGHALRTCLLGMRLGAALQLRTSESSSLYYGLLLKDIGCSSNAARMCQIVGGNEIVVKAGVKLEDWTKTNQLNFGVLKMLWKNVLPQGGSAQRIAKIVKIGLAQQQTNAELVTLRCDRGASIVRKLGLDQAAAEAVRYLDEHWDGSGYPEHLIGSRVPLLSRIMLIAQHLDVFSRERGYDAAMDALRDREGRWFDPEVVRLAIAMHRQGSLWSHCGRESSVEETRHAVLDIDPGVQVLLDAGRIDWICEAFTDVVDAKSPFTFRHSMGVAQAAIGIAQSLGMPSERVHFVRRAALLHDIGKLNVSNSILDKPTRLDAAEWQSVREHPGITRRILERVSAFQEIAVVAGEHHEKLDGTGYPYGLSATNLSLEARIIAVADVYGALTETRPYREGMSIQEVVATMGKDVPGKLDHDCFEALLAHVGQSM